MQYMIMFHEPVDVFEERNHPPKAGEYWGAWSAYVQAMYQSGIVVSGAGLQPPHTAVTVRMVNGDRRVQDGPVAATKEQLGGYFVVEVESLDDALAWAARSPSASYGVVEVRPVLPPMNQA